MNDLHADLISVIASSTRKTYLKLWALTCHRFHDLFHEPLTMGDVRWLCETGDLQLLSVFLPMRMRPWPCCIEAAARGGQLKTLLFLIEKGCYLGTDAISEASGAGHLEVVQTLYDLYTRSVDLNQSLVNAAIGGHLDILKWFISMGYHITDDVREAATVGGHQNVIAWIPHADEFNPRKDIIGWK